MPLPYLNPLFQAASQAYQDIRKPKDSSTFRQGFALMGATFRYTGTSGHKKSALAQLFLVEAKESIAEQNSLLTTKLAKLEKDKNDDVYFKTFLTILTACATLTQQFETLSTMKVYTELQAPLHLLQSKLGTSHVFFKKLTFFFQESVAHEKELLAKEYEAKLHTREKYVLALEEKVKNLTVLNKQGHDSLSAAQQTINILRKKIKQLQELSKLPPAKMRESTRVKPSENKEPEKGKLQSRGGVSRFTVIHTRPPKTIPSVSPIPEEVPPVMKSRLPTPSPGIKSGNGVY